MRLCSALVLGVTAATLAPAPAPAAAVAELRLAEQRICAVSSPPGERTRRGPQCADAGGTGTGRDPVRDGNRHRPQEADTSRRTGAAPGRTEVTVPAADQQQPSCGDPRSADFPLDTRIHGGPGVYRPGGDSAEWFVDLTNDTGFACHDIHPVLVLVDSGRNLAPDHVRAEFYDTASDTWHPVPFVRTDEDELVGAFGDGIPGFTVGAGRTVSVRVRLAFTDAARAGSVVATTAVVQRKDHDGEWVGRSADYRFDIDPDAPTGEDGYAKSAKSRAELAETGSGPLPGLGALAAALLLAGTVLVAWGARVRAASNPSVPPPSGGRHLRPSLTWTTRTRTTRTPARPSGPASRSTAASPSTTR